MWGCAHYELADMYDYKAPLKDFDFVYFDLLDYEAHLQEIAGRTEDHKEGVQAFLEKRKATFTGR